MTEKNRYKNYQTYYRDDDEKWTEGIKIKKVNLKEALLEAEELYGEESKAELIKEKKKKKGK